MVERAFSWLLGCRLDASYDQRANLLQGVPHLAQSLIRLHGLTQ